MATSNSPKQTEEDLISSVLDILPDKILEFLPIRDAARTSVLSKQWRSNWLSLKCLDFDFDFFYQDGKTDWQKCCKIISSILLHHQGSVHQFNLFVPYGKCVYLNQWLSFLSENEVRYIEISGDGYYLPISSHIFWCSELVHLELANVTLHSPPSGFIGFPNLKHLVLRSTDFSQEDILSTLITTSRRLATLMVMQCRGMSHIVINAPSLETLTIDCDLKCESIAFGNVRNLKSAILRLYSIFGKPTTIKTIDSFNNLASSRQLQCIEFGYDFCKYKFLAAASIKRPPMLFQCLNKLSLNQLELSSLGVLQNIFNIVESCHYLKKLFISIKTSNNAIDQKLDYSKIRKSDHLLEVEILGISGANVELQLIEFMLNTAVALERLLYMSCKRDRESQLKLSKVLSEMPKASQKARLISWPDFLDS